MPPTLDETPLPAYDPGDHLRHDLKSPLTTIYGRAQLLGRAVRRAPSLSEEERTRMLESLAIIEAAVYELVAIIDAMPRERSDTDTDETDPPP